MISLRELISDSGLAGVRCLDVCLLRPGRACSRKHVDRAGQRNGFVILIAVDALCSAGFARRGNGERVAVLAQRDGIPEFVALSGIRSLDVCLLRPRIIPLNEDINRTRAVQRIVLLVSVDTLRAAALIRSSHGQSGSIATECDAVSFVDS